jgi:hypothetical protein
MVERGTVRPKTQEELDLQAAIHALGISEDDWNAGARAADATWWQQPHECSPGRTYEKRLLGYTSKGWPVYEQVWTK